MQQDTRKALALAAFGIGAVMGAAIAVQRRNQYSFRDRTVVITGGSRGLGLVLARQLANEGARLAICSRTEDQLRRAEAELSAMGAEVFAVPCDVTDREQLEGFLLSAEERFGGIDVLINNAGVINVGPLETQTPADFELSLAVHFWAPLYATLAVLPGMRRRGEGRIVNISSIGGKISVPHLLPYSAGKFALVGLSEGLRAELAKDGISVTTVCPGLMRTGSHINARFKGNNEAEYAWFTLSDSLPGSSISTESAARQILSACRRGDAEIVLSLPASAVAAFHGLFPGATADMLGVVNRLLPPPGGIGTESVAGRESETPLTQSWLTALSRKAATANNET